MATDHPTERTPLIEHHPATVASDPSHPQAFLSILNIEREIYADSEYPAIPAIIKRKVDALTTSPSTGTVLKLLLTLRYLSGSYFALGKDSWIDSRSAEQDAIRLVTGCWEELHRTAWSQAALDEALWTQFPLENGKNSQITLIETMLSDQSGLLRAIQLDDRVALSLLAAWKNGRPRPAFTAPGSTSEAFLPRIESFATPRVLHLIDLAFYLVIVTILGHSISMERPPYPEKPRPTFHFYCILVYTVCRILRNPRPVVIHATFILTLVAFLMGSLTEGRARYDTPYNLLLLSFFLHFVQLLLPLSPSFALLDPRSSGLPVSSMLHSLFTVVLFPALQYFIPLIFVILFTLIMSIQIVFITPGLVTWDLFLFVLWFSGLLFSCLVGYMTLSSASLPSVNFHHPGVPASWNTYSLSVGVSLRRHLCHSVITYSKPYFFPVPLNVIPAIFVDFPYAVLHSIGEKRVTPWLKGTLEPVLWRFVVLPLVFIFGAVWLWR